MGIPYENHSTHHFARRIYTHLPEQRYHLHHVLKAVMGSMSNTVGACGDRMRTQG